MPRNKVSKNEDTRTAILDSAYDLFTRQGYHATSMRYIADSVGLVVAGLYNHFRSKDAIFMAVLHQRQPFLQAQVLVGEAEGETAKDLIRDAARRLVTKFETNPDLLNLMFIELVEFDGRHLPDLVEEQHPHVGQFADRVSQAGGQSLSLSPRQLFHSLLSMVCFAYILNHRLTKDSPSAALDSAKIDDFINIYLFGVLQQ